MVNSSNPHNYGKDLRYKYRFAVLNKVGRRASRAKRRGDLDMFFFCANKGLEWNDGEVAALMSFEKG